MPPDLEKLLFADLVPLWGLLYILQGIIYILISSASTNIPIFFPCVSLWVFFFKETDLIDTAPPSTQSAEPSRSH